MSLPLNLQYPPDDQLCSNWIYSSNPALCIKPSWHPVQDVFFCGTLCHPPTVVNVSLIVSCVNLVSVATWGTLSSTAPGRNQTCGLCSTNTDQFSKVISSVNTFYLLINLWNGQDDISRYCTHSAQRWHFLLLHKFKFRDHLVNKNKLNLQYWRWPPGGDMGLGIHFLLWACFPETVS